MAYQSEKLYRKLAKKLDAYVEVDNLAGIESAIQALVRIYPDTYYYQYLRAYSNREAQPDQLAAVLGRPAESAETAQAVFVHLQRYAGAELLSGYTKAQGELLDRSWTQVPAKDFADLAAFLEGHTSPAPPVVKDKTRRNALIGLGIALAVFGLLFVAVFMHLKGPARYYRTVFLSVIPAVIFSINLSRLLFKKGLPWLVAVFSLIFVVLFSYIALLPVGEPFFKHAYRAVTAIYELAGYYIQKGGKTAW